MNQAHYLNPHEVPPALRGGYTGTKFKAVACERAALHDTYWSGGTRSTYVLVEIATGRTIQPNGVAAPHAFGGTLEGAEVEIPSGYVLREHSTFCGKDHGLTFYVRPADIAPLLPKKIAVSDDELTVLAATASYKNSYGGRTDIRFTEASEATGITRQRWNDACASLTAMGMLRANGSITVEGKNALGAVRLGYRGQGLRKP